MNKVLEVIKEGLRRVRKVWIWVAVVLLGLVLGVASFANGTISRAFASLQGNPPASAPVNVQTVATPTQVALGQSAPDVAKTATAMPGMVMPTSAPAANPQTTGSDMDALLGQMQQSMQALQSMMGQLEQQNNPANKAPAATPTTAPRTVDLTPMMAELQDINRTMQPLIQRIQADLQGKPSAEEIASVRAQVAQIQVRMTNLMNQLQAARNGTAYVPPAATVMPGMGNMPGMGAMQPTAIPQSNYPSQAMMNQLDSMMRQMQTMLQQMMTQQPSMGMNMAAPTAMPGMANSNNPSMSSMMSMMDNMMSMMDNMMGGSSQANGMNMPSTSSTPMAGMGNNAAQSGMMNDMMMMMDNMMMMMNNMMQMDMMGMPDM